VALTPRPEIPEVLARFGWDPVTPAIAEPGGHINESYRVGDGLLQRLNPLVFPDGAAVLSNVALVSSHLRNAALAAGWPEVERRVLTLFLTPEGAPGVQAPDGAWWRLCRYLTGTRSVTRTPTRGEAVAIAAAFGEFHQLMASYQGPELRVVLPDFHDPLRRVTALETVARTDPEGRKAAVTAELAFARSRAGLAARFMDLLALGEVPSRLAHNDAKPGNVLLDVRTGEALAVIDLDTVMPGTLLTDVGDLIRSVACSAREDEVNLAKVHVRRDLFAALLQGWFRTAGTIMVAAERAHWVMAGLVITYEQGVRFLTDHLAGDRYYRIARPGHNLDRARVQFRLLEDLEREQPGLERLVRQAS
jgi:aminoglycoside phosphotransferase (APT) family kinase protein